MVLDLSKTNASQLIDMLAHPVSPEPLRAWDAPVEIIVAFREALANFEEGGFQEARNQFLECHRLLGSPARGSEALRNASLSTLAAGQPLEAYAELAPSFSAGALYGPSLWNFAVASLRAGKYESAIEALTAWKTRPVEYLLARACLLGATAFRLLDRNSEAREWLEQAISVDADYSQSRLIRVGVITAAARTSELSIRDRDRALLAEGLRQLLQPRKPDRYPSLGALQINDFRAASEAIDRARDDDFAGALASVQTLSASGIAKIIRAWIESSIHLQLGDPVSASRLIESVSQLSSMPGSVWWNWAASAALMPDYAECSSRLGHCVGTDFSTKAEAWVALAISRLLSGERSAGLRAVERARTLSERARSLLAQHFAILGSDTLQELGISLHELGVSSGTSDATAGSTLDLGQIEAALKRGNVREAVDHAAGAAAKNVTSLPEYESAPLEPPIVTSVPRLVITLDLQSEFRRGVSALLRNDASESVTIFEKLSSSLPKTRSIRVNHAAALFRAGSYIQGLVILQTLVARSPDAFRATDLTGVLACLVADGRWREAEALIENERTSFQPWRAYLYRAVIAERQGHQRELAEQLFGLARNVERPSHALLGLCALRSGEARDWNRAKAILEAAVSGERVIDATAGSTWARSSPKTCRSHREMQAAFDRFVARNDWRAATDFFSAVVRFRELEFYGSNEERSLVPLLNGLVYLGRSQGRHGHVRSADESLRTALQLMHTHRERLEPGIEASLAELAAAGYGEIGAPWRQHDALEVALKAAPGRRTAQDAKERCQLPEVQPAALHKALQYLANELEHINTAPDSSSLDRVEKALADLGALIGRPGVASSARKVCGLLKRVFIDGKTVDISEARDAASALDAILLDFALHVPSPEANLAVEYLGRLQEQVDEILEDVSRPPLSVDLLEAHHDGTNATMLFECRTRSDRMADSFAVSLGRMRELQPAGARYADAELDLTSPGQRQHVAFRLGITGTWPASQRIRVPITAETIRSEKGGRRRSEHEIAAEFTLFEQANITYPGGAIGPEDFDGRPLYGRTELVARLANSLQLPRQGRLYFLFGPRKVGKTSVLKFVVGEIRRGQQRTLAAVVNFDKKWPDDSPIACMASEIVRAAARDSGRLPSAMGDSLPTSMEDFRGWLRDVLQTFQCTHVVLLLDEFWALIKYLAGQPDGASFLGDLRDLWSGEKTASLLIADWHSREELSSSVNAQFWADLAVEPVGFLDEASTRQAIRGPATGSEVTFSEDAVAQIYYLTQGYPWHLQELCDLSVRAAAQELRHTIIADDVESAKLRLLADPRTFKEGVFKPDRVTSTDEIVLWKLCRYTEGKFTKLPAQALAHGEPGLAATEISESIARLEVNSALTRVGEHLHIASPIFAEWVYTQFSAGIGLRGTTSSLPKLVGYVPVTDSASELRTLVMTLLDHKRRIQELCVLRGVRPPFKGLDYRGEESVLIRLINGASEWDAWIGALKRTLVDDLDGSIDELPKRNMEVLASTIHALRLRRNYVEHPQRPSKAAREAEMQQRFADLGKPEPTDPADWRQMQLGLISRVIRATTIQLAEFHSGQVA
jgi:tetratricopeptide (TPR) repeat protein